jgi:hypothetical protein
MGVIRATFAEQAARWFHFIPFKHIWKSSITGQEQHMYDKLYTSDTWMKQPILTKSTRSQVVTSRGESGS